MSIAPGTLCEFIASPCTPPEFVGKKCIYEGPTGSFGGLLSQLFLGRAHPICDVTLIFEPGGPSDFVCQNTIRPLPPLHETNTPDEAARSTPVTS